MGHALLDKLGISLPLIQAPMAGGLTTPALCAAASQEGALGSLGAAYLTAKQLEDEVADVRRATDRPFAINLFAGGHEPPDDARAARVAPLLAAFRKELGLPPENPPAAPAATDTKFELVLQLKPHVFSFTFGLPPREQLTALRARGIFTIGTATHLEEALALQDAGVDAIAAQGAEAGGHRGTFIGLAESALIPTFDLVPILISKVRTPIIAAGGLMDGASIARALKLGAAAVQLGTAFMNTREAGTPPAFRDALTNQMGQNTVITRGYSGRAARAISNRFTEAFAAQEAAPYPQQQQLTKDIRAAAIAQSRADLMQMLSGQGAPRTRAMGAGELIRTLVREAGL